MRRKNLGKKTRNSISCMKGTLKETDFQKEYLLPQLEPTNFFRKKHDRTTL